MTRSRFLEKTSIILALSLFVGLFITNNSYAFTPSDVTKKAYMYGLKQCYDNGAIRSAYASIKEYSGGASLYEKNAVKNIPLPSSGSAFNSSSKDTVDCKTLIRGSGKLQSAYEFMGHPAPASGSQDVGTFLKTYAGYTEKSGSAAQNGRCVFFKFRHTSDAPGGKTTTEDVKTDKICFEKLENDVIKSSPTIVEHDDGSGGWRTVTVTGGYMGYEVSTPALKIGSGGIIEISGTPGAKIKTADRKIDDVINEVKNKWESTDLNWHVTCEKTATNLGNDCTKHSTTYEGSETPPADSLDAATASYSNPDGNKAIRNLMGCEEGKEDTCIRITREERVRVYMNYLTDVLGARVMCNLSQEQISGNSSYDGPIKWFESGKTTLTQNCYVQPGNTTVQLNGIGSGHFQYQSINYNGLIEFFKNPDITELSESSDGGKTQPDEAVNNLDGANADANGKEPSCFDNTGALGWVLCPLTIASGEFVQAFYSNMIQPFLQIDVGLFTGESTDGATPGTTRQLFRVWQIFQGFANIVFVALFLFVIFSQITGYGIDNYGIKKTLPRLILGAIMINASFIICQLAVEVSNIIGIGVRNIFEGIQVDVGTITVAGTSGSGIVKGTIGTTGGLVVVAGIVGLLIKNGTLTLNNIVVAVLMAIVVIIVALILLFVVLALRYALAVLLVVISPLAFVCYMLPNTKKLFDRWLNMFKGLLMAYPIVSALVFGGELIGKLLLASSSGDTPVVLMLAVAIMSIAPIFLIPSVLTKSLGVLSGAFERIRGRAEQMTGSARGGLSSAMQQTRMADWSQHRRKERARTRQETRDKRTERALEAKKAQNGGNLGSGDSRRLAAIQSRTSSRDAEETAAHEALFANMSQGDIMDQFGSETAFLDQNGNLDVNRFAAALSTIAKPSDRIKAFEKYSKTQAYQRSMNNIKDRNRIADVMATSGATGAALAAAMRKDTILVSDGKGGKRGMSFDEMMVKNGVFDSEIKDMGLNIAQSFVKDDAANITLSDGSTFNLADHMNSAQHGAVLASSPTGDKEEKITNDFMNRLGADGVRAALGTLDAQSAANITDGVYDAASKLNNGAQLKTMLSDSTVTALENDRTGTIRNQLGSKLGDEFVDAANAPMEVVVVNPNEPNGQGDDSGGVLNINNDGSNSQTPPNPDDAGAN